MDKLNGKLQDLRIPSELEKDLEKFADSFGLKKTDFARMLIIKGITELKADSQKAGGIENLRIEFKSTK